MFDDTYEVKIPCFYKKNKLLFTYIGIKIDR